MKRGTLRGFDAGTYTATVEIDGSIATYLVGVPVARNIDSAELVSGRSVALWAFDAADPHSILLIAVWV